MDRGSNQRVILAAALVIVAVSSVGGCSDDAEDGGDGDGEATSSQGGGSNTGGGSATSSTSAAGGAAGCLSCGDVLDTGVEAVGALCEDQKSLWQQVNDCACDGCVAACNCQQDLVQSIDDPCGACLLSPSCSAPTDACEAG